MEFGELIDDAVEETLDACSNGEVCTEMCFRYLVEYGVPSERIVEMMDDRDLLCDWYGF